MIVRIQHEGRERLAVLLPDVYKNPWDAEEFGNSILDALTTISSYTETKNAVLCGTMCDLIELAQIFKNLK